MGETKKEKEDREAAEAIAKAAERANAEANKTQEERNQRG